MYTKLFNTVDLLVVPIILVLLVFLLKFIKSKQPLKLQPYFYKGFYLRVFGTITLSLIYQFIFGYGDTFGYYHIIQVISSYFTKDPSAWLDILINKTDGDNPSVLNCLDRLQSGDLPVTAIVFKIPENIFICKIASVLNIICFNSYLGMALFFGAFSFLGCWYIFKTFVHIFPGYEKQFAWYCLYLPSLWFWGNGILKDPICIFALGLLFYNIFVKQQSFLGTIFTVLFSIFLLLKIKPYIFYTFFIATGLGLLINSFKRFNILGKIFSVIVVIISILLIYPLLSDLIVASFEDLTTQSQYFIDEYSKNITEGDSTIIPTFDPSVYGFLKLSLGGLVTVFMRPFPWELNKILYLFLILENLLLYVIIFWGVGKGPLEFKKNHKFLANFCIVFFIFLGIIIGITTFNLGTIARYRVPALPFLFAGIFSLKLTYKKRRLNNRNYVITSGVPA